MDNYICINGKKAELTEEQMKALGIELPKESSFERQSYNNIYYYIQPTGLVVDASDYHRFFNDRCYEVANYCTDKAIMGQRALHEILNRLLWRFSMEHDGDKIDWESGCGKFRIYYYNGGYRVVQNFRENEIGTIYFYTEAIAEAAITEIIEPFMKAHPEFKW